MSTTTSSTTTASATSYKSAAMQAGLYVRRKSVILVQQYRNERLLFFTISLLFLCSIIINIFFATTIKPATFAISNAWSKRPGILCDMEAISKQHLPSGKHHMVDFYGVDPKRVRFLEESAMVTEVSEIIAKAGLTLLDYSAHHFDCGGITAAFLLSESHVSFHSWPEHGFVALDVYTCGLGRPEEIVSKFKSLLKPKSVRHTYLERGAETHLIESPYIGSLNINLTMTDNPLASTHAKVYSHVHDSKIIVPDEVQVPDQKGMELTATMTKNNLSQDSQVVDLCVNGNFEEDDCYFIRKAKLYAGIQSPYQHIEIIESSSLGRCMLLDRVVQFCTQDNLLYNQAITDRAVQAVLPDVVKENRQLNIVIVGGGDGWVASYLLDHYESNVQSIQIVDIDEQVTKLTQSFFNLEGKHSSYIDPRVKWTFTDAVKWLAELPDDVKPDTIDLVIIDCTDHIHESSKVLYTTEFYSNVYRLLRPKGRMVQQMNTVDSLHTEFHQQVRKQWHDVGLRNLQEWTTFMESFTGLSLFWMAQKDSVHSEHIDL